MQLANLSKNAYFSIQDVNGVERSIASGLTKFGAFGSEVMTEDTTTFGDTATYNVPTLFQVEKISIEGIHDVTANSAYMVLKALHDNGGGKSAATPAATAFVFGPRGNAVTNEKISGNAWVTKLSVNPDSPQGIVKFTAELTVTGPLTKGTF